MTNYSTKRKTIVTGILAVLIAIISFCFLKNYLNHPNQWKWVLISVNIIIFAVFYELGKLEIKSEKKYIFLIILSGLLLRMIMMLILRTKPVSDFDIPNIVYQTWQTNVANGLDPLTNLQWYKDYYTRFPAWYCYFKILFTIYNIFGFNVELIKIVNLILYSVTSGVLYYGTKKIAGNKIAQMALPMFCFLPNLIVYTSITTPDHFALLFISLTVMFWGNIVDSRKKNHKKNVIICIILMSICASMVNLFKPIAIYYLIAFFCAEIVAHIFPNIGSLKKIKEVFKENAKFWGIFTFIFIVSFFSINKINTASLEKTFSTKVVDSTPMYMLWAFAIDESGEYNPNVVSDEVSEILGRHTNDMEGAMHEFNFLAKEQFKANKSKIPSIILSKLKGEFISEYTYFYFANMNSESEEYSQSVNQVLSEPLVLNMMYYMMMLFLLFFIAFVLKIISLDFSKEFWMMFFLVFGYSLILLLGAIQGRYKCLMLPQLCICASYGLNLMHKTIQTIKSKVTNSRK